MLKIAIYYLTAIMSLLRFLDWYLSLETKAQIKATFRAFAMWLDTVRPMNWLLLLFSKLTKKGSAIFIGVILIIYTASRFLAPNAIEYLSKKELLTAENLVVFFIGTCIALLICARLLTPLILSKNYLLLVPILLISLSLYVATGYALKKYPWILELITDKNLPLLKVITVDIIVFVYGCLLWVSILSILSLSLFFGISLLFIILSLVLRVLARVALWLTGPEGKYTLIFFALGTCVDIVDTLIKKDDAEEARKTSLPAPGNAPSSSKRASAKGDH